MKFLQSDFTPCRIIIFSFIKKSIEKTVIIFLLSLLPYFLQAQNDSLQYMAKLVEIPLEQLLNIKVITASKFEQKISEAPSTMMVITAQQITERGYEQLDDVLRDIPGVDLIHIYGLAPTLITFRGMYGDENRRLLFMVDGIVENNIIGTYEMAGPAYSLHNVERVEILWGPGSALYGANAFGAVINIITKKGANINGLQYQKGYGSFNTSTDNVMLGIKRSNIELALSGSLFKTDGPRFDNQHPKFSNAYVNNAWSLNWNISYSLKKVKTTLGASAYQTPCGQGELTVSPTVLLGLPSQGNENTGKGGIMPTDFNGEKASLIDRFSRTGFLNIEYTPNEKLTLAVRGQYKETGVSDKSYFYVNPQGQDFLSRGIYAYDANRIKGEISANYIISQHHTLSAGFQYSQDNLERGLRGVNPDTKFDTIENIRVTNIHATFKPREYTIQNNVGSYLQYVLNTNFLGRTNFTLGGRFDKNNVYGATINPRIGLVNQPNEKITIKLLFGSAFRAPTNFELYTFGPTLMPNPDLKPEKIKTYEANIIYAPVNILSVQANVFQNELADVIIQNVPVGGGILQNQNVGTASIKGLETKVDIIPSKSFSGFVNFTYQEGKQYNGTKGSVIPNIANVKGNIGILIHIAELLNINLIENWVGKRSVPATNPLGKVKEYFITNLVISTNKLFNKRVSASLNIRNLFNQTYYDPGIRTTDGNFYPTVNEQPGINGLFKISLSLF